MTWQENNRQMKWHNNQPKVQVTEGQTLVQRLAKRNNGKKSVPDFNPN